MKMSQVEYLDLRILELEAEIEALRAYAFNSDFQRRANVLEKVRNKLKNRSITLSTRSSP